MCEPTGTNRPTLNTTLTPSFGRTRPRGSGINTHCLQPLYEKHPTHPPPLLCPAQTRTRKREKGGAVWTQLETCGGHSVGETPSTPFRTWKLSPTTPMVLHPRGCGRVGHRRTNTKHTGAPCHTARGPHHHHHPHTTCRVRPAIHVSHDRCIAWWRYRVTTHAQDDAAKTLSSVGLNLVDSIALRE